MPPVCVSGSRPRTILEPGYGNAVELRRVARAHHPTATHPRIMTTDVERRARQRESDRLWKARQRARAREGSTGDGTLPPEQYVEGLHWNGRTRHSEVTPLTFPYVRKCSMCGRHPPVEWITEARARLLSLAGLSPCVICNGWVFMELQEVGGMGSPTKAAPARTVAEPVRSVHHHAA